ncbi:MAG: hypothetical protein M5R42_16755 [Rhodocyclaceae bacterium]|nr:hypothetical protein [Rhodocyclaceae bacterium]
MDFEVIKTGLVVINMVGTFSIGAWLYIEKRSDKTNARIDTVEARSRATANSSRTSKPRPKARPRTTTSPPCTKRSTRSARA